MTEILVSILFSLLCSLFFFYHLKFNIAGYESMYFIWSFIFPTLVMPAWGRNISRFLKEEGDIALVILTTISISIAGIIISYIQRFLKVKEEAESKESQYRNIFENINDIYYELDHRGTILVISPSVQDCLGYAPEALIGKNVTTLYTNTNQQKKLNAILHKDKRIDNYEIIAQDIQGRERIICLSSKMIVNNQGKIGFIGAGRDVTKYLEAKRVQQETEVKYKILAEKMMTGFIVLRPIRDDNGGIIDYIITNANPSVYAHIKIHHYHLIGLKLRQYEIEELVSYEQFGYILQEGKNLTYEVFSQKYNLHLNINAFKISDQELGIVFNNITSYKNAVRKIEELNEDLEERVFQRTEELHNAISELEVFSYTITHDLKSPLRAIDAYSSIIVEDYGKSIEPIVIESLSRIQNLCKETIEMINKLLEYSITTKTPLVKESVDLNSIFMSVYHDFKKIHTERELEFIVPANLPHVMVDKILMRQVVDNILSNSIKFTRTRVRGIIEVGFEIKEEYYLFFVKDNGVGFDMSYSGKVFGIFERLHSDEEFEGSGIGLAIVQKIIQRHGGETMIEGRVDVGTTFYFTLPQC